MFPLSAELSLRRWLPICAAVFAVLALSALPARTQVAAWTVADPGTLGGAIADPGGMNAAGQMAGTSMTGGADTCGCPIRHAFLARDGAMTDLGTLGGPQSAAAGINARGQVAGTATDSDHRSHAFLWTPTEPNGTQGVMADLGTLPGGTTSRATGINALGQVVGVSEEAVPEGFVWTPVREGASAGTMVSLGAGVFPAAINASGQVAGWRVAAGSEPARYRPFLFTPFVLNGSAGRAHDLGVAAGFHSAFALALDDQGHVAGYDLSPTTGAERGFFIAGSRRWQLPETRSRSSRATAIADLDRDGRPDLVGGAAGSAGEHPRAYLYRPSTRELRDANELLPPDSGYTVTGISGIGPDGSLAAAALGPGGQRRAVLLMPGEPVTVPPRGDESPVRFSVERVHLRNDRTASELGIGCKVTRTVMLVSESDQTVDVGLVVRDTQIGPGDLRIIRPRGRFKLRAGAEVPVRFTYETQQHGDQTMVIQALVDEVTTPRAVLEVFASPDPVEIEAPEEVDFGTVAPGRRARQRVTLRLPALPPGQGPCKVNLTGELTGDPAFSLEGRGGASRQLTLAPGRPLSLFVLFRPPAGASGEFEALLSLAGRAFDGEKQILLTGRTGPSVPPLTIDPVDLDFGRILVGTTKTLPLRVRNNTTRPIDVRIRFGLEVPGPEAPFFGLPAHDSTFRLAAGGSREFSVEFRPPAGNRGFGYVGRQYQFLYDPRNPVGFIQCTLSGRSFVEQE